MRAKVFNRDRQSDRANIYWASKTFVGSSVESPCQEMVETGLLHIHSLAWRFVAADNGKRIRTCNPIHTRRLVRVRSREEISSTLDPFNELKGCAFLPAYVSILRNRAARTQVYAAFYGRTRLQTQEGAWCHFA